MAHSEDGWLVGWQATAEKERLEVYNGKFLAAAKTSKKSLGEAFPARWFEVISGAAAKGKNGKFGAVRYRYKGGYWEARKAGNFSACPDFFMDCVDPKVV